MPPPMTLHCCRLLFGLRDLLVLLSACPDSSALTCEPSAHRADALIGAFRAISAAVAVTVGRADERKCAEFEFRYNNRSGHGIEA